MKSDNSRIPVTLVTGFLGAGKTTLLNRILRESHGKRIAVVENEFGEISIDDALLANTAGTVFKMSNGCLCCTSNGDLVNTLLELSERSGEFDYVIVECTGVANPTPVIQTFLMNEDISDCFQLDTVVTLVDAKHFPLHAESKECIQQVALADIIILNKTDLVSEDELAKVSEAIRAKNKLARVHRTTRTALELTDILDQNAFSESSTVAQLECVVDHHQCGSHSHDHCGHDHGLHHHHHDEEVSSVGLVVPGSLDAIRFNMWFHDLIRQHGDKIFRIKGILSIAGKKERVIVQSVHRASEVDTGSPWADEKRETKIVFIGEELSRSALLAGLSNCVVR